MNTHPESAAGAAEICKNLEHAVLRYFPLPAESSDAFSFAHSDNITMAKSRGPSSLKISIAMSGIKRSLGFLGLWH